MRCECPELGIQRLPDGAYWPDELIATNHPSGKCQGTRGLKEYTRNGLPMTLCSVCVLSIDIPVDGKPLEDGPPEGTAEMIFEYKVRQTLEQMIEAGLIEVREEEL